MSSLRALALLLIAGSVHAEDQGFLIGGGLETDSDDGVRGILFGGLGVGE